MGSIDRGIRVIVTAQMLTDVVRRALEREQLDSAQATLVAETLVEADLRGVHTHGVARLPVYVERLRHDVVNRHPEPRVTVELGGLMVLDGDNGMGFVVAQIASERCIELARRQGVALVAVSNSNHFGTAAHYVELIAAAGLVGIAISNGPPVMAPTGSARAYFGANPLAVGLPVQGEAPVVLDMSTTVAAQGHVLLAAARGERIPLGWALNAAGEPTDEPAEALRGAMLPFGGHKGSGIALAIEALTGLFVGGSFGPYVHSMIRHPDRPQDVAHAFIAISTEALPGGADGFARRVEKMTGELRSLPPAAGSERVLLPGEREHALKRERLRDGIPIDDKTWEGLVKLDPTLGRAEVG